MSYAVHAAIVESYTLRQRITACAAQEGVDDPPTWAHAVIWTLPKNDWITAWSSADVARPGEDHGDDAGVITDGMILSSVQARLGA